MKALNCLKLGVRHSVKVFFIASLFLNTAVYGTGNKHHSSQTQDFIKTLTEGQWRVSSFEYDGDNTEIFDGISLDFIENGKVVAEKSDTEIIGKWKSKDRHYNELELKLWFSKIYPFKKLNTSWYVKEYNGEKIIMGTQKNHKHNNNGRNRHHYKEKLLVLEKINDQMIIPLFDQGDGKTEDQVLDLPLQALGSGTVENPSTPVFQINNNGEVLIELVAFSQSINDVFELLNGTYNRIYSKDPSVSDYIIDPQKTLESGSLAIDLFFPIDQLLELNERGDIINFGRTIYSSFLNSGIITSQGDGAQRTNEARTSFQFEFESEVKTLDGSGIKIGVISNSFGTEPYTTVPKPEIDVSNGDLPGTGNPDDYTDPVQVLKEYQLGVQSDEGRAMLQIVHDVAPGASLAFHAGSTSLREFEEGIQALIDAGCDMIVDDVTFITEPFFQDGRATTLINNFVDDGKMYFTSSGNFGSTGYQSVFNPSTGPVDSPVPDPDNTLVAHVFGYNEDGEDTQQGISVSPGTYMIVLQWNEPHASQGDLSGAVTDLDLYLVTDGGGLIVGNNRINIEGDPTEILLFQALGEATANLMIINEDGTVPPGLEFRYIAFQSQGLELLEYNEGAPTASGHAMASGAVTTGAIFHGNADSPSPEFFTSLGGFLTSGREIKIDIAAPDGGNVNVQGFGADTDGDGFANFYGTSASAPHAAGAMALLLSAQPSWYPEGIPDELVEGATNGEKILSLFQNTALDAGPEELTGPGLIQADLALDQIAARKPLLTELIIEDGKTPSSEPFIVTIIGTNFTQESSVTFNEQEVEVISRSDTSIQAIIGPFDGNPALYVSNDPITPGETDGGDSNLMYIFEGDKVAFFVQPDTASVEFGQDANFSYQITGLPEGISLDSLGLPALVFNTPAAFPYPDVNSYLLTADFTVPLTPEQEAMYQVNFMNSLFTVSKKDLIIKATDLNVSEGDLIEPIMEYVYNSTGISNNEEFMDLIRESHASTYYPENRLAVMNKFKALVNEGKVDFLEGSSWMITEAAVNKFKALVNGLNIVELEADLITDYQNDPASGIPNKFKALVNGQSLLDGNAEIFDAFENKFKALVNDSGLGDENDKNDYSEAIAIVDEEDSIVQKVYSIDLVSGLEVTTEPDSSIPHLDRFLSEGGVTTCSLLNSNGWAGIQLFPNGRGNEPTISYNINEETAVVTFMDDGTAYLMFDVINKADPEDTWHYDVYLMDGLTYTEWSAQPDHFIKNQAVGEEIYSGWTIYLVDPQSKVMGTGINTGIVYDMIHNPVDERFGVQVGFGANPRNMEFNMWGWWALIGQYSETIEGDVIFDLGCEPLDISGEPHYIVPGALLDALGSNFNLSYEYGRLIIEPSNSATNTRVLNTQEAEAETLEPILDKQQLELYPNPVTDYLTIRMNNLNLTRNDVNFFDSQGRILQVPISINEKERELVVDLSTMKRGIYFLRINLDQNSEFIRLIKR